jgi:MFS superfamily sulfate permease-like transporter
MSREARKGLSRHIKGELAGAVSVVVVALPSSIGLGITAFAALGPAYTSHAAMAGVYCAVMAGFLAPLLGGTSILVTGTRTSLTLVLSSVVATLVQLSPLSGPVLQPNQIISLVLLCVFMGGLFQVLFGLFRLGDIAKYIPYPVIAGFMNGLAILIMYSQVNPLLGLDTKAVLGFDASWLGEVKPLSLMVGFSTLTMVYLARRFLKGVPPSLAGLIAGTVLYYLSGVMMGPAPLGPTIGSLTVTVPTPAILQGLWDVITGKSLEHLRLLLFPALILCVFGSIESLMSAVAADNVTSQSHNSNRVLIGQGVGNMMASLFGGISGAGTVASTLANYQGGGRTALSGMAASIMMLLIVLLFGRFVGKIPLAAIAGILVTVGVTIFDRWSLRILWRAIKNAELPPEARKNLLLTILVTLLTISVNLVMAIALGFGVATVLFLSKMGRSVIHRRLSGSQLTSKKVRPVEQSRLLKDHGHRVLVLELHGPIFFGSAEKLLHEIESAAQDVHFLILDMKHVNEIDSTGAKIMTRIHKNLQEKGRKLLVSYMAENHPAWMSLVDMEVIDTWGREHLFADTDRALERAEEQLLDTLSARPRAALVMDIDTFDVFKDLNEQERSVVKESLHRKTYRKGDMIIQEGQADRNLFFLTQGEVSIGITLSSGDRSKRLATYGPGTVFGEVELLDGSPRSASAWADRDSEIFHLTAADFESLRINHPGIAHTFIANLARELSLRLRMANEELRLLEDS